MNAYQETETGLPAVGSLVVDTRTDRLARVMDVRQRRLFLRPPCGGREWEAVRHHVRPATEDEIGAAG